MEALTMEALTMEALMVVEVLGAHNRVRARHRIAASDGEEAHCTVGRSVACDVMVDDPFVAAVHVRIAVDGEGNVLVSDLDSVNGIEIGGRRLHGVERVPLADGIFRIGRTRLRVRTPREVVAPEQAEGGPTWQARTPELRVLALGFALTVALTVFEVWTNTARPRDLSTALVTSLLLTFTLVGLWITLWALATRVAFGESRWARHALIAFVVYAGVALGALVAEVVNGALGLHLSSSVIGPVLIGVAVSAALSSHLRTASPMRAGMALAIGVTIPALAVAAMLWIQVRGQNRNVNHIGDHDRVLPPALLLRRAVALDTFMATLADLKARADAKRAFVEREDPSPDEDAD